MNRPWAVPARIGAASFLTITGVLHAQRYLHGYRAIPVVGPGFLLLASGCFAVALLLACTGDSLPRLAAAALALGALAGFTASRTIGIFGFVEYGFQPAPQALLSVLAEIAALGLLAASLPARTGSRISTSPAAGAGSVDDQIMTAGHGKGDGQQWRA